MAGAVPHGLISPEHDFALHGKERAAFWCQSQCFKALAWRGQPFGCRKLWKRKMRALA